MDIIEIDYIRIKQFCLFERIDSTLFGKIILRCIRADLVADTAFNLSYSAIFQKTYNKQIKCKLVYFKKTNEWFIESSQDENIRYKLIECTDNVAKVISVNDLITYKIGDTFCRLKVIKHFPKYKRFVVAEINKDINNKKNRHNLSTILKSYPSKNIVSITTYDTTLNENTL